MIFKNFKFDSANAFRVVLVWDNEDDPKKEKLLIGRSIDETNYPWIVLDTDGTTEEYRHIEFVGERSITQGLMFGDIIKKDTLICKRKILGVTDEVVFVSSNDNYDETDGVYTVKELINNGYKLFIEDSGEEKPELVHLTIQDISDGKGKGIAHELIRIKE